MRVSTKRYVNHPHILRTQNSTCRGGAKMPLKRKKNVAIRNVRPNTKNYTFVVCQLSKWKQRPLSTVNNIQIDQSFACRLGNTSSHLVCLFTCTCKEVKRSCCSTSLALNIVISEIVVIVYEVLLVITLFSCFALRAILLKLHVKQNKAVSILEMTPKFSGCDNKI